MNNTYEEKTLAARLIPPVAHFKLSSEALFRLCDGCQFIVKGDGEQVIADAERYWRVTPKVQVLPPDTSLKPEAYTIEVTANEVTICASTCIGTQYAMKTLRQLAETERGVLRYTHYILPAVRITDEPALLFRGMHICWFPETPAWEIEKQIRLAAYYKFNYVGLGFWGNLKLESHPEFSWDECAVEQTEVSRLVKLAKELGVTLIPQANLFGHASDSRVSSGKHALLSFHPEYASLFEPDGWTWCLSNRATRKYLTDIVCEIYELFENPPYFFLGFDEAYNAKSCALCRRSDYRKLVKEHLLYFYDLLKQRGSRVLLSHDMLLSRNDARWEGYITSGNPEFGLGNLYEVVPKDVIICDWQYDYPEIDGESPTWPTMKFFQENGFEVIVLPWLNAQGTASLGKFAAKENLLGVFATSWNLNHGQDMFRIYYSGSIAAWGTFQEEYSWVQYLSNYNRHLREIDCDMKVSEYSKLGSVQYQINPHDNV